MTFINAFDIGSFYQNVAFYAFLIAIMYINVLLLRTSKRQKTTGL